MVKSGTAPLWEIREVEKTFPGVRALQGVSLEIKAGEIHGLLGENGSGKSTLVKCLSGVHRPSGGQMLLNGETVVLTGPLDAQRHGVATIFQEFSLVPQLSVAENIFLGRLPMRAGLVDWATMNSQAVKALSRLLIDIEPAELIDNLSVAQKQMVEIAKALSLEASLFIFDEPTAAIGVNEIENLHGIVRQLASSGCAVIYISHRMDEVLEIVDKITVLKDGRVQGSAYKKDIDLHGIVRLMTGTDISEHYPKSRNATDLPLLEVRGLCSDGNVNDVSFTLNEGEVLGLAGLIGSGRTEIARALFGVDAATSGSVSISGKPMRRPWKVADAIRGGFSMVTEDRKAFGLFMNFDGPKNTSIASLQKIRGRVFLKLRKEMEFFGEYLRKFSIPSHILGSSVENLSGGNQQKVVISRWIQSDAKVFIFDEPTRGIDIGAKIEVYKLINELTSGGKAVILVSSDYDELLSMSDRIAFVRRGGIVRLEDARGMDNHRFMKLLYSQGNETKVSLGEGNGNG